MVTLEVDAENELPWLEEIPDEPPEDSLWRRECDILFFSIRGTSDVDVLEDPACELPEREEDVVSLRVNDVIKLQLVQMFIEG